MTCRLSRDTAISTSAFPPLLASLFLSDDTDCSDAKRALPVKLDGSRGINRASGPVANHAQNDLEALSGWLFHFSSNQKTFASYRREAERLLLWAILNRAIPLSSLTHTDLTCYRSFLTDPQPRERWVTTHGMRVGRTQDSWRPFAGPLSQGSARQSLAILNRMFSWLVDTGYLMVNPLINPSRAAPQRSLLAVTLWPMELLKIVTTAIDSMPHSTNKEKEHGERARWLFSLLYFGGLSISEIANNAMGAFCVCHQAGSAQWAIEFAANSGRRVRKIATPDLVAALLRYRHFQELPPVPEKNELTPLVLPIGGRKQRLGPRALYGIIRSLLLSVSRMPAPLRSN